MRKHVVPYGPSDEVPINVQPDLVRPNQCRMTKLCLSVGVERLEINRRPEVSEV